MATWETYRLYRLRDRSPAPGRKESTPCGTVVPTRITFRARSQEEAERKALKLSRDGDLQLGIIIVKNDEPIKNRSEILDFDGD